MTAQIIEGDCLDVLPTLADASVGAVVTDPPYDLTSGKGKGFMGKCWDGTQVAFRPETWAAVLKVLRPGGYLLAFGGTRTYHRMACAIEDAGFEIRDSIAYLTWVYGSGFPKSLDISKAIDKAAGADRNMVGKGRSGRSSLERVRRVEQGYRPNVTAGTPESYPITIPATDAAKRWAGWGTALKPAHEPIVVARKPLSEGTVAANVLEHGTGGLNVDACRVPIAGPIDPVRGGYAAPGNGLGRSDRVYEGGYAGIYDGAEQPHPDSPRHDVRGRFPPNLVLSHHPDCERVGVKRVKGSNGWVGWEGKPGNSLRGSVDGTLNVGPETNPHVSSDGTEAVEAWRCVAGCAVTEMDRQSPGVSRFFPTFAFEADDFAPFLYCAKASRSERDSGLEGMAEVPCGTMQDDAYRWERDGKGNPINLATRRCNTHPTVKPVKLCSWLCRLVTPPGGLVLDPFAGSGSTGVAALREGFRFLGIEQSPEYCAIARRRLEEAAAARPLLAPA